MKNKISMALKDPILQQGFEIICKHLEEKDKEIKDLEWQLKEVTEDNDSYQKDNTEKDKQIERLNNFIDEQRTTIARQIVELTEKENDKKELLGISDVHNSHKLFEAFEKLEFKTTYNKAIQAFYLERGLYVVRSESLDKYQYTLVKASSEEMAIRKCM